ncbi:MAG: SMC family ATPase, partial [Firmicutes bacterium]|nr:SMC family ATPase [Bacillota bacterium]
AWKTLDERLKAFNSAWRQSGFSDVEAYRSAKRTENALKILADAVKSYQEDIHALKNRLERAQKAAEGLKEPDLEKLKIAADESYRLSREAVEFRAKLEQTAKDQTRLMGALEKVYGEMAELEGEYGVLTRIANVAGGKHPNTLGMNFETFILAAMLDQVAEAASHRLQIMSKGRYSLKRTLERRTARSAGGLGLEVFDMYTGRERSVTTLSGGEGFMASLSLALGLADVVQAASGGIHLDTIFIDEGFGALDPEALDLALDTLIRLQKDSGSIVGVISHVPELAERIDTRLKVEMTDMGSKTRFIVD